MLFRIELGVEAAAGTEPAALFAKTVIEDGEPAVAHDYNHSHQKS